MKKWQYYIAYGSNLNIGQMARRCPEAEMIGTGRLEQYELEFRGREGNAHANIAKLEEELEETEKEILKYSHDFVKLNELSAKKEELANNISEKMDRWMYLEELAQETAK